MKKKLFSLLLCTALALTLFPAAAFAADDWRVASATWQDPENVVLLWEAQEEYTYEIYRSDSRGGTYESIGSTAAGSFRDGNASWPEAPYYRVQSIAPDGTEGALSQPIQAGTNQQKLDKVTVIMYHNFIGKDDILNGWLFDEYSLHPAEFEADLQYLRQNGYTTITSADLLDYINGEKPLPAKAVILSIDDGTWGVYTNAFPLLQSYGMKADFNLIGENIDNTWQELYDGGTRDGQSAPYCVWEEILEMQASGAVNICSHTYGLHRYNSDGRVGTSMMDGERPEDFALVVQNDYALVCSSTGGWTGVTPTTMAYPYSRRSSESDEIILANTGYEILMGGNGARGTAANYFVRGADAESQLRIMSRPCRMEGHPIQEYLAEVDAEDQANGVNTAEDPFALSAEECTQIARYYSPYTDVSGSAWYAGAVYYAYVNALLTGTSRTEFSPSATVSRAMAATLLYRMAGEPAVSGSAGLTDVPEDAWYAQAARWAAENDILPNIESGVFAPNDAITREELVTALYRYALLRGLDLADDGGAAAAAFSDHAAVSPWAADAVNWATAADVLNGDGQGHLLPQGELTRAELATILQNWSSGQAALFA